VLDKAPINCSIFLTDSAVCLNNETVYYDSLASESRVENRPVCVPVAERNVAEGFRKV
jgi:hypothetical protein